MSPFRSSIYWRLLIWFCVANLLVLFLGGLLTRGFIEYTTAKEINWVALGQGADQAYESGGAAALADWSTQQRREGIEATLYEKGQALYPIRLHSSIESSLPSWLASIATSCCNHGRDSMSPCSRWSAMTVSRGNWWLSADAYAAAAANAGEDLPGIPVGPVAAVHRTGGLVAGAQRGQTGAGIARCDPTHGCRRALDPGRPPGWHGAR
jgi:hypothetical protein